jgi:hypothetical protein
MLRKTGLLVGLLLIPGLSLAAGGGDKFTPADFEKILKNDLNKEFAKKQGKDGVLYDIKDTPYYALFQAKGKFLLFFVRGPVKGVSLQQLNDWNRKAVFSRAYLTGKVLTFEVPLSFAAGTTPAMVRNYYQFLEKEWGEFKDTLKGGD